MAGGWRYQTHADLSPYVERFLLDGQRARMSGAALETLAIIAYKQPLSRAQIASIRGVDPDGVIRTLQARGYVAEVARDTGPGQAILFGTTPTFLEKLGLELAVRPAADRRVRPRRRGGRGPRAGPAHRPAGRTACLTSRGGRTPEPPLWEQLAAQSAALPQGERLQKVLAMRGWGSRRVCEDLIAEGRVTVNGEVAVLGRRVDAEADKVEVDGVPLGVKAGLVHYLLNKPEGVVTTASDPQGRPTVVDLVPAEPRVYPVGRLDVATEGLLLLTNDGDLAHRIAHPSHGVEKEYLAEVEGSVGGGALRRLRDGIELEDGITAPAKVSQPEPGILRITIHEGRNRQVRRMCEAVGHPVTRLVRVRIGPLRDAQLKPGEWRELDQQELKALMEAVAGSPRRIR